jgi:hypothetical protein
MSASNGNDDLGPRLEDDGRALAVPSFDPHIERGVEALLAVGNGYLGADPGVTYRCERLVALRTSRDAQEPRAGAVRHAGSLGALGPGRLAQEPGGGGRSRGGPESSSSRATTRRWRRWGSLTVPGFPPGRAGVSPQT